MKKILIIGSDSFIASKFIEFSADCFEISGYSLKKSTLINESVVKNYSEITQPQFENMDVIVNFAAIVHRPEIKDKNIYDEVNHKLAVLIALKAKQAGVGLFIQMSTIAIYGNATDISIETPTLPITLYGQSKLIADLELMAMQDDKFKVAIVRPPMVYGGGKAPGNMMRLISLVSKRVPLPFKGIDNQRDFINVHNLVQYLAIIANKQLHGVFLVSDHQPVSTEYLIKLIVEYIGNKAVLFHPSKIVLKTIETIFPKEYQKLYGALKVETNFPYYDLIKNYSVEQGIHEMVKWYKSKDRQQ